MPSTFLVFAYDQHYPYGGMGDYKGTFVSIQEASALINSLKRPNYAYLDRFCYLYEEAQVVRLVNGVPVEKWLVELCDNVPPVWTDSQPIEVK